MYILGYPLGLIMRLLYNLLHSYGWSLILFTLLIKLVMVPLSIKQQKSSAKIAAIQPQMQEIQKMYAKNQQKRCRSSMSVRSTIRQADVFQC